jgi:predicted TIM-barrel enzyme
MNCPTLALVDGNFRRTLEETGVKFDMEVEMIAIGHRKGLYTKAFCTTPEEAQKMMDAGCDNIIAHGGNTSGGSIGSKTATSIETMVGFIQSIIDTVKRKKPDVIVTCHGGATETPEDVKVLLDRVKGLEGYVGGSTAERIPVEKSITEAIRGFKNIQLPEKTRWK